LLFSTLALYYLARMPMTRLLPFNALTVPNLFKFTILFVGSFDVAPIFKLARLLGSFGATPVFTCRFGLDPVPDFRLTCLFGAFAGPVFKLTFLHGSFDAATERVLGGTVFMDSLYAEQCARHGEICSNSLLGLVERFTG